MSLMSIQGFTTRELVDAANFLKTEKGVLRREEIEARAAQQRRKRSSPKISVEEFWDKLRIARESAIEKYGEKWYLHPECYRWGTVPKNYVSAKGQATTHRWPRDQKIPHARYWPNQMIPDIGIVYAGV